MPRWIIGPAVATIVLAILGFPQMALFASGGGLLIAVGVAFWAGTIAASLSEPHKFFRHAATVAVYLLALMGLYVTGLQQRAPPPGTSVGGPNVPPP
ncbi:MAG TPA: hypothetical protein VMS40_07125 [Vicinamibacterales bacterium]|nr:hypothetical protein [Vicinamibacterales bacterium]